ncbi:MAG: hypothetical protein LUH05_05055 [Candidatus Gastranaerophilales bacterium]|nr:hypothetical protein [Candidatus Gastranaerophilales bacterium]
MYYIPASLVKQKNASFPVIIFVPGYNGDGEGNLPQSFYSFADKNNFGILTPAFVSKDCELYDQTSYHYPKTWSGAALIKMLEKAKKNGLNYSKLYMVGFSAGAQFVSKFSLLYPEMVDSCAILSSGGRVQPETKNNVKYFIGIVFSDNKFRLENAQIFSNACKKLGIYYKYKEYYMGHETSEQEWQDVLNFFITNRS